MVSKREISKKRSYLPSHQWLMFENSPKMAKVAKTSIKKPHKTRSTSDIT